LHLGSGIRRGLAEADLVRCLGLEELGPGWAWSVGVARGGRGPERARERLILKRRPARVSCEGGKGQWGKGEP
jgi:hypothetical protein